jgi:hypothetical protein
MTAKLIEKTEVESSQDATLKIERIVLSKYATNLLRAQPAAKVDSREKVGRSQDETVASDQNQPAVTGAR